MALSLQITSEKAHFAPGESIPIKLILKNESAKSVVTEDFAYNSNLTEIIVKDSSGNFLAKLNDYTRQMQLGMSEVSTIEPQEDLLRPNDEREVVRDISQYLRLISSGKYFVQGSYTLYRDTILSEPLEIEILPGKARNLRYTWQFMNGSKWKCHLIYLEGKQMMHMEGYFHNPEVIDYNLIVEEPNPPEQFVVISSSYDQDDFHPWIMGYKKDKLFGFSLDRAAIAQHLDSIKLTGMLVESAAVETYDRQLVVPEIVKSGDKEAIRLHLFSSSGQKLAEKDIPTGPQARVFAASSYNPQEYMIVYGFPVEKGFDLYIASGSGLQLEDLKSVRLCRTAQTLDRVALPCTAAKPEMIYACSFDSTSKELRLHRLDLASESKKSNPPAIVLKSQGALALAGFAVNDFGATYLIFVEDGKKLLYYNYANDQFRFITEARFSDPQLIVTPYDGVFLAYIDESQVVRFIHAETVLKKH